MNYTWAHLNSIHAAAEARLITNSVTVFIRITMLQLMLFPSSQCVLQFTRIQKPEEKDCVQGCLSTFGHDYQEDSTRQGRKQVSVFS
jgi:hypothetical protein